MKKFVGIILIFVFLIGIVTFGHAEMFNGKQVYILPKNSMTSFNESNLIEALIYFKNKENEKIYDMVIKHKILLPDKDFRCVIVSCDKDEIITKIMFIDEDIKGITIYTLRGFLKKN